MSAPSAPRDDQRPAAEAAAAELAHDANVDALARHAAQAAGDGFFAQLMAHELVLNHRLFMRFGAMADDHLGYTSPTIDPDRRQVGRDSVQYAAIAARMSERVRQGALALAKLAPSAGGPTEYRVTWIGECASCGKEFDDEPDGDSGPEGGGPDGGGDSGSSTPHGSSAPPSSGGQEAGGASLRRGRLNNNNPVGDYAKSPRCGARTRAGGSCRQPAMANGRCRLHGGKSTGPRTAQGLANSRAARLRHGRRTGAIIKLRSAAATHGRRLVELTRLARDLARHPVEATGQSPLLTASMIVAGRPIPAGHGLDRSDWPLPRGAAKSEHGHKPPRMMM